MTETCISNIDTKSRIEEVRIFFNGAEIKRRLITSVVKGKNIVMFDGLPQDVRSESINASVEKGGKLISAEFEIDSFTEPAVSKRIKTLNERYENIKKEIKKEKNKLILLRSEEKFLDSNRKASGEAGPNIEILKKIEKYHKERKEEIAASKTEAESALDGLRKEKERIARELGSTRSDVRYAGKISVELFAEDDGPAEITVSYYISNGRWRPFHEIRMSEIDEPVILSMKGDIVQNTGEDWTEVKVKLSTGNPMLGNDQPVLSPWYIDIMTPQRPGIMSMARQEVLISEATYEETNEDIRKKVPAPQAKIEDNNTTTEFLLPAPLDIPSSDRSSKVEISRHTLDMDIFYYCVSKLDPDAFLIARMEGWESLNILAGEVSIFQGNDYVGKTHIDPRSMEDTMEISLGRDKGIIVTRERGNNMTSKGMIGKNTKVLREWIITVRNTKARDIKMKLIDQLPISVNSSLSVEPVELSGAEYDKETGMITWNLSIQNGEAVKKVLRYEVTHPKNGTVYLD